MANGGALVVEYISIYMKTNSTFYFDDIRSATNTDKGLSTKMQEVIQPKRCLITSVQMIKIFNIIHLGGVYTTYFCDFFRDFRILWVYFIGIYAYWALRRSQIAF